MKKLYFILLLLILPVPLFAAPTINTVTGTFTDGQTITLSGSGFGIHADEDTGSANLNFEWETLDDNLSQNTINTLTLVNTYNRTGSTYHMRWAGTDQGETHADHRWDYALPAGVTTIYMDYWVRLDSTWDSYHNLYDLTGSIYDSCDGDDNSQLKTHTIYTDTGSHAYGNIQWEYSYRIYHSGGETGSATNNIDSTPYYNVFVPGQWTHYQVWFDLSDVAGSWQVWINNVQEFNHRSYVDDETALTYARLVGYTNCVPGYSLDDGYLSFTRARVEIGNASAYSNCTHTEIQILTAWATGEITATLNTGSFGDTDTVYLYVVDSDGVVNADGYAITLGDATPAISGAIIIGGLLQ